jgi:hypothetical protein
VFYDYGSDPRVPTDELPPNLPRKRLGISQRVADCAGDPRPVAFVETRIKKVFVNESAAP